MSGRSAGSSPYRVTESKAVDRRRAASPWHRKWKRRLVRSGAALAGELALGLLVRAPEGPDPGGVGELAGHVLLAQVADDLAPAVGGRQLHLGDAGAGQGAGGQGLGEGLGPGPGS